MNALSAPPHESPGLRPSPVPSPEPRLLPALRLGRVSIVWRPRHASVVAALTLTTCLLFLLSLGRGDYPVPIADVVDVLTGADGPRLYRVVVLDWRMPRAVTALTVGAAFGLAGALSQITARNPLASPDLLGITAGASAMVVTVIVLGTSGGFVGAVFGGLAGVWLPAAAIIGAAAAATAVAAVARVAGFDPFRLVLAGIIIHALLQAHIAFLLIRTNIHDAATAHVWLIGSLGSSSWPRALAVAVVLAVAVPACTSLSFRARAMSFDPDTAAGLGLNVRVTAGAMLALSVALAAVAVAAAGPIGFVAFAAPNLAARLTGAPVPPLAASTLAGAALVLGADVVSRTVLPVELPVGLLTSVVGGLMLVYLLIRHDRRNTA